MEITPAQVCEELLALFGQFKSYLGKLADVHDLTRIQLFTLYTIAQRGDQGLPMGHVAVAMHCDASNVTGIVDRLVSQGLAVREEGTDRRSKILHLTPKGKHLIGGITAALPAELGCTKLTPAERGALYGLMHKLSAAADL